MDESDDAIEIPIEAAQEYITTAIGFAPLHLSDLIYNIFTDNLCELVENVVGALHVKHEQHLTQDKVDALKKMLKIKLQGQQNVLFDQFDNFIISDVFNIHDNVVLPEDLPQTTYSKKKHDRVKESIDKHEKTLMLLNLASERIDIELEDFKVLQKDLEAASSIIEDAIKTEFDGATVQQFIDSVNTLSCVKDNLSKALGYPADITLSVPMNKG